MNTVEIASERGSDAEQDERDRGDERLDRDRARVREELVLGEELDSERDDRLEALPAGMHERERSRPGRFLNAAVAAPA